MLKKYRFFFVVFLAGLVFGVAGLRLWQGWQMSNRFKTPKSDLAEYFENDPDLGVRNFVQQLSDPSQAHFLPPLLVQTYNDGERFSIAHKEHRYVLASELFDFSGNGEEMHRVYAFKESDVDILFVIARNIKTNKIMNVHYSFNGSISYFDRNGDGIWDVVKGVPVQEP